MKNNTKSSILIGLVFKTLKPKIKLLSNKILVFENWILLNKRIRLLVNFFENKTCF